MCTLRNLWVGAASLLLAVAGNPLPQADAQDEPRPPAEEKPAGTKDAGPAERSDEWGPERDGLRTRLLPSQEKYAVGGAARFRLEMKNFGKMRRKYDSQDVCVERLHPGHRPGRETGSLRWRLVPNGGRPRVDRDRQDGSPLRWVRFDQPILLRQSRALHAQVPRAEIRSRCLWRHVGEPDSALRQNHRRCGQASCHVDAGSGRGWSRFFPKAGT